MQCDTGACVKPGGLRNGSGRGSFGELQGQRVPRAARMRLVADVAPSARGHNPLLPLMDFRVGVAARRYRAGAPDIFGQRLLEFGEGSGHAHDMPRGGPSSGGQSTRDTHRLVKGTVAEAPSSSTSWPWTDCEAIPICIGVALRPGVSYRPGSAKADLVNIGLHGITYATGPRAGRLRSTTSYCCARCTTVWCTKAVLTGGGLETHRLLPILVDVDIVGVEMRAVQRAENRVESSRQVGKMAGSFGNQLGSILRHRFQLLQRASQRSSLRARDCVILDDCITRLQAWKSNLRHPFLGAVACFRQSIEFPVGMSFRPVPFLTGLVIDGTESGRRWGAIFTAPMP